MGFLERVHVGPQHRPRRCLIYGTHGIGKSTFASNAPSPIFLSTEDGVGDLDVASLKIDSYDTLLEALTALYSDEHGFETVVIDSIDKLETLIWEHLCQRDGKATITDYGYGKGYAFALGDMKTVLDGLDALRETRGMTVILIGHSQIKSYSDPENESYDRYSPNLHKDASEMVQRWADEVLFAKLNVYTESEEKGHGKSRSRGISSGSRVLCTTERPAFYAKNRLGLPEEMPLAWIEYGRRAGLTTPEDTNPQETSS